VRGRVGAGYVSAIAGAGAVVAAVVRHHDLAHLGAGVQDPSQHPAGGVGVAEGGVGVGAFDADRAREPGRDAAYPQQLHLDTTVPTVADLDVAHERALALGARLLEDRSDDPEEPLRVYADPAGHPFCIIAAITGT
jgi:hypothetical protein